MNSLITYIKGLFRKEKEEIESQDIDISDLSLFYELKNDKEFKEANKQVVLDLDLNDVFYKVDRANSIIGKQYLYNHIISQKVSKKDIDIIEKNVDYLIASEKKKNALEKILQKRESTKLLQLPHLFIGSAFPLDKYIKLYYLLSFSAVLSLILSFFNPSFLLLFIFIAITNTAIHYYNKRKLFVFLDSISQLETLYNISLKIEKTAIKLIEQDDTRESIRALSKIRHWLRPMSIGNVNETNANELMAVFLAPFELLKGFFLIELIAMHKVLTGIETQKEHISILYKSIGKKDLYLSILKLREQMPYFCKPKSTMDNKTLVCEAVIHPLVEDCIPNSISLNQQSLIITGSNMSGKTTFLRTIAINNILGNTLNTCFAKKFEVSRMQTLTSIRVKDDLLSSKSFFFEEVSLIKTLIDACSKEERYLFIIDELFKGTNTRERIAASKSILHYLNKTHHIILFSTHDLELIELLDDDFERGYFTESVDKGEISFNYTLNIGKSYDTNAIKILELNNYPQEIIDDAYRNIKEME
ncbi:MAG: hypothetical protein WC135_00765 [Bacteroidales bacterium]